tara:strand:- start:562 stop:777 length:216 start_codon:yes stop_codon:yes gene_type:complete
MSDAKKTTVRAEFEQEVTDRLFKLERLERRFEQLEGKVAMLLENDDQRTKEETENDESTTRLLDKLRKIEG